MAAPKIKLLYFKNILDLFVGDFIGRNEEKFARRGGLYIMSEQPSLEAFSREITEFAEKEAERRIPAFDVASPEYLFVLGGCEPPDNMLLGFRDGYFPAKLDALLKSENCPKYFMKERDVEIDGTFFNRAADMAFGRLFRDGFRRRGNAFAIRHRHLDCYALFKIMKYVFGWGACSNSWAEDGGPERLTAVNDLICRYVNNKTGMNGSPEFKAAVREIGEHAAELMKNPSGV